MYEHRTDPLLPRPAFRRRIASHFLIAAVLLSVFLIIGVAGFRITEHYQWVDAFLNTCMLLGGMGQVNPIITTKGKLFAGVFALIAGVVFIAVAALVVTPFAHRLLHALHLESDGSVPGT
jgi:hypothetical protein